MKLVEAAYLNTMAFCDIRITAANAHYEFMSERQLRRLTNVHDFKSEDGHGSVLPVRPMEKAGSVGALGFQRLILDSCDSASQRALAGVLMRQPQWRQLVFMARACRQVSTPPASANSVQISSLTARRLIAPQAAAATSGASAIALPRCRMASSAAGAPALASVRPF